MISRLLKFSFFCLILWGAVTWLGASLVALGIAVLAAWMALLGLDSANMHATELQQLRERLATLVENLDRAHAQMSDDIDRMREQNRRLSERVETMEPTPFDYDY